MGQTVAIVCGVVSHRNREDSLADEFRKRIADETLISWIVELLCKALHESQAVIDLAKEQYSGIRGDPLIDCPDLDGSVELWLKERRSSFTHGMILHFVFSSLRT